MSTVPESASRRAPNCNQHFEYRWDEVGRLVEALRWDGAPAGKTTKLDDTTAAAHLKYTYDAGDDRVVKEAIDRTNQSRYTIYLFSTLELRRASWLSDHYQDDAATEVAYLSAHGVTLGRLWYEPDTSVPTNGAGKLHVFYQLGDALGSTSVVLDQSTSELVERTTFEGYGATESDYRPSRWNAYRADRRFTGKEDDVEVGLYYFGKRYLNPFLGRWVSADPLAVQGLGADLNVYAYVHGGVLQNTDPLGLDDDTGAGGGAGKANQTNSAGGTTGRSEPAPAPGVENGSEGEPGSEKQKGAASSPDFSDGAAAMACGTPAGAMVCGGSILSGDSVQSHMDPQEAANKERIAKDLVVGQAVEHGVPVVSRALKPVAKAVSEKLAKPAAEWLETQLARASEKADAIVGKLRELADDTSGGLKIGSKAAAERAKNVERGIPESELGPSGKPKIHVKEHATRGRAEDAAQARSRRGTAPEEHSNPTTGDPHFHPRGSNSREHHTYPGKGYPRNEKH